MPTKQYGPDVNAAIMAGSIDVKVESFHINVGAGDGAIHLLTVSPAAGKNKRRIKCAIYLDGGRTATITDTQIDLRSSVEETIAYIEEHYEMGHSYNHLIFDVFIISHWDGDHYRGVLGMLVQGMLPRMASEPAYRNSTTFDEDVPIEHPRAWYTNGQPNSFLFMPELYPEKMNRNYPGWFDWSHDETMLHMYVNNGSKRVDRMNIINLRCDKDLILGQEFFHLAGGVDNFKGFKKPKDITSVSQLLQSNKPSVPLGLNLSQIKTSLPGMYCIAIQQTTFGPYGAAPGTYTYNNKTSIATLIAWNDKDCTCSHYSGGDTLEDTEARIATWINSEVTSMKASHHGSSGSTPASMLTTFSPINLFISAGTQYAHPRWEILMLLEGWLAAQDAARSRLPLFLTTYPYYLVKDDKDAMDSDIRMSVELAWNKTGRVYKAAETFNEILEKASRNSKTKTALQKMALKTWEFLGSLDGKTKDAAKLEILRHTYDVLDKLSGQFTAASIKDIRDSVVVNETATKFVRIISTDNPKTDGEVHCWYGFYTIGGTDKEVFSLHSAKVHATSGSSAVAGRAVTSEVLNDMIWLNEYPTHGPDRPGVVDRTLNSGTGPTMQHQRQISWVDVGDYGEEPKDIAGFDQDSENDDWQNVQSGRSSPVWAKEEDIEGNHQRKSTDSFQLITETSPIFIKSTRTLSGIPWDTDPIEIPETSPFFLFLDALHWHTFILTGPLANSPPINIPIPFAEDDEWQLWMTSFLHSWNPSSNVTASSMAMIPRLWPPSSIDSVDMDFAISFELMANIRLTFDTASASTVFGHAFKQEPKVEQDTKLALKDMLAKRVTLAFGLSSPQSTDPPLAMTLAELSKLIRFDTEKWPVIKALGPIDLSLDTSPEARNAMWFRPTTRYETDLRLQFKPTNIYVLDTWLAKVFGDSFKVNSLSVIARNKGRFLPRGDDDYLTTESSLTLLLRCGLPKRNVSFEGALILQEKTINLVLTLPSSFKATAVRTTGMETLKALTDWFSEDLGLADPGSGREKLPVDDWIQGASDDHAVDNNSVTPRRVQIELSLDANGSIERVNSASIDIQISVLVGKPAATPSNCPNYHCLSSYQKARAAATANTGRLAFLLTFGWSRPLGIFLRGGIWSPPKLAEFDSYLRALPAWESFMDFQPVSTPGDKTPLLRHLDLTTLMSDEMIENIPPGLPTQLVHAVIEINQNGMLFEGIVRCGLNEASASLADPNGRKPPPMVALDTVELRAGYRWAKSSNGRRDFSLSLGLSVLLFKNGKYLDEGDVWDQNPARLTGQLAYSNADQSWKITASVEDLTILHLAQFWDADARSDAMTLLGKLNIEYITLQYFYAKASDLKSQSRCQIDGSIVLTGLFNLKMGFDHKGAGEWVFTASLGPNEGEKPWTLGNLINSLLDTPVDALGAIMGAEMSTNMAKEGQKHPVRLLCARKDKITFFALFIELGSVSFWFVQIRPEGKPAKTVLRAVVNEVQAKAPLFGPVKSPFDKLSYMWVQQPKESDKKPGAKMKDDAALSGVTHEEYAALKDLLMDKAQQTEEDMMLFKDNKKPDDKMKDDEVVMTAGHHFIVVNKDTTGKSRVVLDYAFGKPIPQGIGQVARYDSGNSAENPREKGAKAPLKKKLGPLSVSNVGLWYRNGKFGITLDAQFLMGPLSIALMEFSIGVGFKSLSEPPQDIECSISGLAVSLSKPPLTVAGTFLYQETDKMKSYAGGLIIDFKTWQLTAAGCYATVTDDVATGKRTVNINNPLSGLIAPNHEPAKEYTYAFIFFKLNGPLFSVGFVDVAGLVGGFGVNSDILLPTVDQVFEFPFVASRNDPKLDTQPPIDTILSLVEGKWFRPAKGMYWGAAGLRATAFQMLAVDAVLVVQFGDSLKFGIYGVATLDAPTMIATVKFAHVELGIVCTLDTGSGTFQLQAALSPRSYVLHESCHLTGSMALYSWFKDDTKNDVAAGDWVLTMGGYHQAFSTPVAYPQANRLGISWSFSSAMSITGEAYFAVTPKVCMGGGRLHATLNLGPLSGNFDAFLDFLINYAPFFFQLQSRIAIAVRFTVDLWFVCVRISAEISADLYVSGPPFGGLAKVNFWAFGFTVHFGGTPPPPPPLDLGPFWDTVIKAGSGGSAAMSPSILTGPRQQEDSVYRRKKTKRSQRLKAAAEDANKFAILLTCQSGMEVAAVNKDKSSANEDKPEPWLVRAGTFSFLITLRFAISEASITESRGDRKKDPQPLMEPEDSVFYARPMQVVKRLVSAVDIKVESPKHEIAPGIVCFTRHGDGHRGRLAESKWEEQKWRAKEVIKPVQTSLWGMYKTEEDPARSGNQIGSLLNNEKGTLPLVMGLEIRPPEPDLAKDRVNAFNVKLDRRVPVSSGNTFPTVIDAHERSLPEVFDHKRNLKSDWDRVRDIWEGKRGRAKPGPPVPVPDPKAAVALWATRLGFGSTDVIGDRPKELLRRFDSMVPALPMVAIGGEL